MSNWKPPSKPRFEGRDKARKILRLALCDSAPEGEWQSAAVAFLRLLRKNPELVCPFFGEPEVPNLRQAEPSPCPQPEVRPTAPATRVPAQEFRLWFGKHKGEMLKNVPTDYLEWVLHNVASLAFWPRSAILEVLASRKHESSS